MIGYVGFILVFELLSDPHSGLQVLPGPVHVSTWQKFIGIVIIVGLSILYSKVPAIKSALLPLVRLGRIPMALLAGSIGLMVRLIKWPFLIAFR